MSLLLSTYMLTAWAGALNLTGAFFLDVLSKLSFFKSFLKTLLESKGVSTTPTKVKSCVI